MNKLLALIAMVAAAAFTLHAQAASHAGAAPMKASEPAAKASDAKMEKKEAAKKETKKEEKKGEKKY
jgi:hypothetical protein